MNFNQWEIEIKNNLSMLSNEAKRLMDKPEKIHIQDINRLYACVKALELMYNNIKEVSEN